jgi:hypothetical protein
VSYRNGIVPVGTAPVAVGSPRSLPTVALSNLGAAVAWVGGPGIVAGQGIPLLPGLAVVNIPGCVSTQPEDDFLYGCTSAGSVSVTWLGA